MERNSFVLWLDDLVDIGKLSDAEAGKLFKSILRYAAGEAPGKLPVRSDIIFGYISRRMDRDRAKYDEKCEKRRQAGAKGGKASGKSRNQKKANEANASSASNGEANEAERDPVPVPDPEPVPDIHSVPSAHPNNRPTASPAAGAGECDISLIVEMFNRECPSLPNVRLLSDTAAFAIRERWKQHPDVQVFMALFQAAEASDFLTGKTGSWRADLDWLMQEKNFPRVINGTFANTPGQKSPVPKGASGNLGAAELEAIQRVLREEDGV